jgi:hypothetical protein
MMSMLTTNSKVCRNSQFHETCIRDNAIGVSVVSYFFIFRQQKYDSIDNTGFSFYDAANLGEIIWRNLPSLFGGASPVHESTNKKKHLLGNFNIRSSL